MAPKVTSSSTRNKGKASKPVTKGQSPQRANRQSMSTAQVTRGGGGRGGSATVTNSSQRTNTGSARVTGNGRPALPPGQRGGALATNTKPPAARPQLSGTKPPARLPGGTGGADSVRGSGVRTGQPGAARPALPASVTRPAGVKPSISMGGARGAVIGALGTAVADPLGTALGNQLGKILKPLGRAIDDRLPGINSKDEARRREAATPLPQMTPAQRAKAVRLEQAQPKPPTAVTRSSSGGSGGRGSSGGSGSSRSASRSSAPARSSTPTAPAKPGQKWDDFNPNRGTSKTNNPLMKDMVGRMKDREDKAQASSASKLSSKFNTESNFSGEKLDGSMYKDSFKRKKKS